MRIILYFYLLKTQEIKLTEETLDKLLPMSSGEILFYSFFELMTN